MSENLLMFSGHIEIYMISMTIYISEANEKNNPEEAVEAIFANGELIIPDSIERFAGIFNISLEEVGSIADQSSLGSALITLAVLLAILYIIVYAIKGIFLFMTRQTIIVMSRLIEYDLKNAIYDQYQRLHLAFYKRNNTGDLMNRISEDVSKVRMYLGPAVMYTLNLIVLIVLVIYEMTAIDVELTLYSLLPLPLMSVGIYYVSSIINKKSELLQQQQSTLSTMVQENISGIRVLKAYHREIQSIRRFQDASDIYKSRALGLVKVEALFMPIIVLLVGLSTILTIYIGGLKVIEGTLDLGAIFAFVFYVNMLTWPFASVGWVTSLVQKAEASQKRINEFLNEEPAIQNPSEEPLEVKGKICFEDVHFTYPDSGIKAIRNMNFCIEPGQTLAIIGRTGSGKSTLVSLMARQYDPDHGKITLDGQDISTINLHAYRKSMGYVPQEVFLFSESISDNIGFGTDDPSHEQIENAAKAADVHHNIIDFPKGYDTKLGERGINLSGGQKQRISIARAIIKNPHILIFDDCLSAVDTETEEHILAHLKEIMKGKTSVIVSHRVSSVKHADKIIVMDDGLIIEEGSHDQLLKQAGVYADLYHKQLLEDETT